VITKIDAALPEDVEAARRSLRNSGATEIHAVSSLRGDGMKELSERVWSELSNTLLGDDQQQQG